MNPRHVRVLTSLVSIPSNELREYLKVAYAVKPSKIHAIYHGADIEAFNLGTSEHGVRATLGLKDKFLVGWFGIMSRVRQVEQILLPLIKMTGQTIPNAVFIVGGKGPLRGSFERFISHYKCKNVLYLGYVPYSELGNYVAACDVTLCPLDISSFHGKYGLSRKVKEVRTLSSALLMKRLR